jgi:hypothetical protein
MSFRSTHTSSETKSFRAQGALASVSVWGLLVATVLLAEPFLRMIAVDAGPLAMAPFLLGAAALFGFPLTLVVCAVPPFIFFRAAKALPERLLWVTLAGVPLAIFSCLFLGSERVLIVVAKVTQAGPASGNLAPPFLAGYLVGFAGAYVSLLAFALRHELRDTQAASKRG